MTISKIATDIINSSKVNPVTDRKCFFLVTFLEAFPKSIFKQSVICNGINPLENDFIVWARRTA